MQTMVWTDERMDDLADRMDSGFTRVGGDTGDLRAEVKDLRAEMKQGFNDLRAEMQHELKDVRGEMQDGFKDVRGEMRDGSKDVRGEMQHGLEKVHTEVAELRSMMFRFGITVFARNDRPDRHVDGRDRDRHVRQLTDSAGRWRLSESKRQEPAVEQLELQRSPGVEAG